jgi:hyperosmotically inducible periplasmic protein
MRTIVVTGLCATLLLAGGMMPASAADRRDDARVAADERKDADDTGRNVRDRDDRTLTPMDQGGSEGDRTITQNIRKQVTDHDELSTNAKNVKIITVDGVVTLRGPVKNENEKTTIAGIARKAPGVKRVEDQTEVERNP